MPHLFRGMIAHPLVRRFSLVPLAILPLALPILPQRTHGAGVAALASDGAIPNDSIGIAHISYGNGTFSPARYRHAQEAGVKWNRWVFYWNEIERSSGRFDYSKQDATVAADRTQGLDILGVLMGTPDWAVPADTRVAGLPAGQESLPAPQVGQRSYPEATRLQAERLSAVSTTILPPQGLNKPVFADGTDIPGPGKTINPENPWARFAFQTATRYRGKVRAWEVWNEPDFAPTQATGFFGFWNGGLEGYARLLKVAYLSVKAADPSATVVMGGMAYWFQQDFFPRLLAHLQKDPAASANRYFFDATAWHWYSRASLLYDQTLWVKDQLAHYGISGKAVWITETNLPICADSYLKESTRCTPGTHRGSAESQAAFIIQALAFARAAGVERVFFFQLSDDDLGPGEYFGLVRNDGVARPALQALQIASAYFTGTSQGYRTTSKGGKVEMVTLRSQGGQRIRVIWNQDGAPLSIGVPVEGASLHVVDMDGGVNDLSTNLRTLLPLSLLPATLNDNPGSPPDYIVGGRPLLLAETGVSTQNGRLEGTVRNSLGVPFRGAAVRVGGRTALTDVYGRYRVELLPGLYDVSVTLGDGAHPFASDPALAVPVWAGQTGFQDFGLRPFYQQFLPLMPRRVRPR